MVMVRVLVFVEVVLRRRLGDVVTTSAADCERKGFPLSATALCCHSGVGAEEDKGFALGCVIVVFGLVRARGFVSFPLRWVCGNLV